MKAMCWSYRKSRSWSSEVVTKEVSNKKEAIEFAKYHHDREVTIEYPSGALRTYKVTY